MINKTQPSWVRLIFIVVFITIGTINTSTYAQQDSSDTAKILQDSSRQKANNKKAERQKKNKSFRPVPRTATLLALIPGGGQIYNRSYWKLPIVFGGLGGLGYWAMSSRQKYICYRKAYLAAVDTSYSVLPICGIDTSITEASELKILRDNNQQMFEWAVIAFTVFYGLTILDAFVDAHLKSFDVSDDLSMSIRPRLKYNALVQSFETSVGLKVTPRYHAKVKPPDLW
ncbi:MAG: hypothetical protein GY810_25980 [Aureispira sp.]|nr:hypothetical protein [Aureispira sp.]